jgi:DNA-binding MarR family transcriptional regulator
MKIHEELKLKSPVQSKNHEALLNFVITNTLLSKLSEKFFSAFKLTDSQWNILLTLNSFEPDGLSQQDLSDKLVMSKSNIVGLIDKLEKADYLTRTMRKDDRRFNCINLTKAGLLLIEKIEKPYFEEVNSLMNVLNDKQKENLIESLELIRAKVKESI